MKNLAKKATLLSMILAVVVVFTGCGDSSEKTKEYTAADMTITLPDSFVEKDMASVTTYLESRESIVTALKEDATSEAAQKLTLQQYTDAVLENNKMTGTTASDSTNGKYQFFTYEKSQSGKDYYYLAATFKNTDAFWLLNLACETKNKDEYEPKFKEWLDTVTFE